MRAGAPQHRSGVQRPSAPGHPYDRIHDAGAWHGRTVHPSDLWESARDSGRNQQIVHHIHDAAERGRDILVLANRVGHLDTLATALRTAGLEPLVLHGRLSPAELSGVREQLAKQVGAPHIRMAIDKIASEGLDLPSLDTLVLASSDAFKGSPFCRIERDPLIRRRRRRLWRSGG